MVKPNAKRTPASKARNAESRPIRDPGATRAALIAAACDIFKREGYFATDTNAIARAAGYAPGSFYNHFPDKIAIFLAVLDQYYALEWSIVAKAAERGDTRTKLRAILRAISAWHSDWVVFRADLRVLAHREPSVSDALDDKLHRQIETIAGLAGLNEARHRARVALIRTIMQRLAETIEDAEMLGATRASVLKAAEDAILALIQRD
jgi:AcrR family transcriptional regulator